MTQGTKGDPMVRQNKRVHALIGKLPKWVIAILRRLPMRFWCWCGVHRPFFYMGHGVAGPCCFHCGCMIEKD